MKLVALFGLTVGLLGQSHVAVSSEIFATEAARFINIQRDNYNSMLTGQNRLKRACSAPVTPSIRREDRRPNLGALKTQLNSEAQRFKSRASALYSAAKKEQALTCRNPVDKVLELFGAKSACSEAQARTRSTQKILKAASDWEAILKLQMKVLDDARSLETRACLSSGFTNKLTQAYIDSVRPQGSTLSTLFDRWTSAE